MHCSIDSQVVHANYTLTLAVNTAMHTPPLAVNTAMHTPPLAVNTALQAKIFAYR